MHPAVDGAGEDDRLHGGRAGSRSTTTWMPLVGWSSGAAPGVLQGPHPVGPGTGGVHDDVGADHGALAGEPVLHLRADHPPAVRSRPRTPV